jgi:hypothetical protein
MRRARASAGDWAIRVEQWRTSGELAERYAEGQGWNVRTLRWWSSLVGPARAASVASGRARFVRLVGRRDDVGRDEEGGGIEVVMAGGRVSICSRSTRGRAFKKCSSVPSWTHSSVRRWQVWSGGSWSGISAHCTPVRQLQRIAYKSARASFRGRPRASR